MHRGLLYNYTLSRAITKHATEPNTIYKQCTRRIVSLSHRRLLFVSTSIQSSLLAAHRAPHQLSRSRAHSINCLYYTIYTSNVAMTATAMVRYGDAITHRCEQDVCLMAAHFVVGQRAYYMARRAIERVGAHSTTWVHLINCVESIHLYPSMYWRWATNSPLGRALWDF